MAIEPNSSPNFLAVPKQHHHVSRLLVLVIILAVIAGLSWLYIAVFNNSNAPSLVKTPVTVKKSLEQQKLDTLKQLTTSSTVKPPADTVKLKTLSSLSKPSIKSNPVPTRQQRLQALQNLQNN
jgi:hypothetical protein